MVGVHSNICIIVYADHFTNYTVIFISFQRLFCLFLNYLYVLYIGPRCVFSLRLVLILFTHYIH